MTKPLRFYVRKKSYKTTRGGIVSVYQVLTNIGKGSTRAKTICAYLNKMAMKFDDDGPSPARHDRHG